jgi:hypothetical protein
MCPRQHLEILRTERLLDCAQSSRSLGMTSWRQMLEARGVGDQERGHYRLATNRDDDII